MKQTKKKENEVIDKELKQLKRVKVPITQLLVSIKSIAALLKASISLSETIETVSEQSSDENLNKLYSYIHSRIEKGSTLAEAMALFPKIFPGTVVSVVDAGEKGGSLEKNLIFIADSMKKEYELNKKLRSAIIYPILIISMTVVEFVGMIFIVLPKMEALFSTFPNIPPLTQFIMNTAFYIRENWMPILGVIIGLIILLRVFLGTKQGKIFSSWLSINFPILKNLFISNILSSFSRTLSVLLSSGIPLAKSLLITANTNKNYFYAKILTQVQKSVEEGQNLSSSLAVHDTRFNKSFVKMINVGEMSGTLEENLMYLHEYYSDDVTDMSNNMVTFVEPILLIFVGLIIGLLGVTILFPIYQLMGSINA